MEAAAFAELEHEGQQRKYGEESYVCHCLRVAALVAGTGLDDEVVASAWLHDVVEDCDVTHDDISDQFGPRVARLVALMTDEPTVEGTNRPARKEITRNRFLLAQGQDAIDVHTLKVADCLDNAASIKAYDLDFWKVFRSEVTQLVNVLALGAPVLKDALCYVLEVPRIDHSRQSVWRIP